MFMHPVSLWLLGALLTLSLVRCHLEDDFLPPQDCSHDDFEGGEVLAGGSAGGWGIEVMSPDGSSVLRIQSFVEWGGPMVPGEHELAGINFRDCGLCVTIASDCTQHESCRTAYYADTGKVTISTLPIEAGALAEVVLEGVVLKEVTIADDLTSTVVSNARTWCVDGPFAGTIVQPDAPDLSGATVPQSTESVCVPEGNGRGIGANVADFRLTNCNGESVAVHSLGCTDDIRAVWMIAAAEWCGPCHTYTDQAKERLELEGELGLVVIEVIGEDGAGYPATIEVCQRYADQHGLDYAETFFDPGWQTLFGNVWPYPTQSGELFFPSVAIARGANFEYVYSSQLHAAEYPQDEYLGQSVLNTLVHGAAQSR